MPLEFCVAGAVYGAEKANKVAGIPFTGSAKMSPFESIASGTGDGTASDISGDGVGCVKGTVNPCTFESSAFVENSSCVATNCAVTAFVSVQTPP